MANSTTASCRVRLRAGQRLEFGGRARESVKSVFAGGRRNSVFLKKCDSGPDQGTRPSHHRHRAVARDAPPAPLRRSRPRSPSRTRVRTMWNEGLAKSAESLTMPVRMGSAQFDQNLCGRTFEGGDGTRELQRACNLRLLGAKGIQTL